MSTATARINMRVSEGTRNIIDRAAGIQGVDRTAFMLDAAISRARSVLVEDRIMKLSEAEMAQVKEVLNAAAEPTPALRRAAKRLEDLGL